MKDILCCNNKNQKKRDQVCLCIDFHVLRGFYRCGEVLNKGFKYWVGMTKIV